MCQAIGLQAIKQGFVVLYRSIFDVVRDFLHDEALEGQEKVLARYLKPDLLIVDDMGIKTLPKKSGEVLFEIILRRYETRSTMMTSNRPLQDWGKLVGDVPAATAILDRSLHLAEILQLAGKSYRLRNRAAQESTVAQHANAATRADETSDDAADGDAPGGESNSKPAIPPTGDGAKKRTDTNASERRKSATPACQP